MVWLSVGCGVWQADEARVRMAARQRVLRQWVVDVVFFLKWGIGCVIFVFDVGF